MNTVKIYQLNTLSDRWFPREQATLYTGLEASPVLREESVTTSVQLAHARI